MNLLKYAMNLSALLGILSITQAAAGGTITENWTAANGSSWPDQWSFGVIGSGNISKITTDILGNRGKVRRGAFSNSPSVITASINTALAANAEDVDATVLFKPVSANDSDIVHFGMITRRADGDDDTFYYVDVGAQTTSTNILPMAIFKVVDGTQTSLGSINTNRINLNTDYMMRFQVGDNGNGGTDLKFKVWAANISQPTNWNLERTDTEARLQNIGGRFGLRYQLDASRQVDTDNYSATYTAIPEPSAAGSLTLLGIGLLWRRRRRISGTLLPR